MTDTSSPAPLAESQPWTLYVGDARAVLASMPAQSANCIVTSPPYWGKRDYGVAGQYGHEDTPAAYVETMRDVFREARRVLADDGTCWLNLGDSYSASGGGATGMHAYLGEHITTHRAAGMQREEPARPAVAGRVRAPGRRLDPAERGRLAQAQRDARIGPRPAQLPARAAVPARQVARLLVRPRPDPRTPRGRCAPRAQAAAHPPAGSRRVAVPGRRSTGRVRPRSPRPAATADGAAHRRGHPNGRNPGDVWSIPTRPYKGPHFAAYPIDLPLRCIAAGCKPGGTVLDPFAGQRHDRARRDPARPPVHRHRPVARLRAARGRAARPGRRRQAGGRAMNGNGSAEITTRNDIARDIIAGFAAVTPTLAGVWRLIDTALADLPAVLADLGRARAELEAVRLDRANLLAAIRATLAARRRGRARPARLPARRTRLAPASPADDEAAVMSTTGRSAGRPAAPARRACSPSWSSTARSPCPPGCSWPGSAWRYRSEIAPATTAGAVLVAGWWLHHGHPQLVGLAARRLRPGRVRARRVRRADRPGPARRAGLRGCGRARGGRVARGRGAARPVHVADAASPGHRRARPRGPVVGAPAPPGAGSACSARSPPGRTSPRRSACPAPRSSPPAWTCGDGGRGSAWPAGRPSPT